MNDVYIHLLQDRDPGGPKGQEICTKCKLYLPEYLERWEEFMNGCFTSAPLTEEGFYLVNLISTGRMKHLTQTIMNARPALRVKKAFVWEKIPARAKVFSRWSKPIPGMLLSSATTEGE